MNIFSQPKIHSVIILLLLLSACCDGHYEDESASLVASIDHNSAGQGVAAWEQPTGDGIAIAGFDSSGTWSGIRRIGSDDGRISIAGTPQVAIAANGDQFILWKGNQYFYSSNAQFYLNHYDASTGTWEDNNFPSAVSGSPEDALHTEIGTDDTGSAWLLWVNGSTTNNFGQIWVAHFDAMSGTWDIVSRLDNGTDTGQEARIAVNGAGVAVATWNKASGNGLWASRYIAGAWEVQTEIAGGLAGRSQYQDLALDDAGNALLAWQLEISRDISEVYASALNEGTGLWTTIQRLDVDSFARGKQPRVSMKGVAGYVAWREATRLWATRSLTGSGIFDMPVGLASNISSFSLTSAVDGRAYLGWHNFESDNIQARTYLPMATGWSSFAAVPATSNEITGLLAVSTDNAGNLVLLWEKEDERNNPDPFSCKISYEQVWTSRYIVGTDSWQQPGVLDTKRLD